ncbi:MAG TPA: VOC family protein [Mycobacteriales bacterium]|jgi:lactoylglutathione lyase|nr:VOC family protein [Mycobacteriales bacterium]
MVSRAFPVAYSHDVEGSAKFWELLGFERFYELASPNGELGYVGLRCGTSELAVTHLSWPRERYGAAPDDGPRFEMYLYVDDLEAAIEVCRDNGVAVLREAEDMPWGERIASVLDPDGNPVTLCADNPGLAAN